MSGTSRRSMLQQPTRKTTKTVTEVSGSGTTIATTSIIETSGPTQNAPRRSIQAPSGMRQPQAASGMRQPQAASGMRQPQAASGMRQPQAASGMRQPQAASGMRQPQAASGMRQPQGSSGMRIPQTSSGSGMRQPQAASGMRPPQAASGMRPPQASSGMRQPEAASGMRQPQGSSGMRQPQAASGMRQPQSAGGLRPPQASSTMRQPQPMKVSTLYAGPMDESEASQQKVAPILQGAISLTYLKKQLALAKAEFEKSSGTKLQPGRGAVPKSSTTKITKKIGGTKIIKTSSKSVIKPVVRPEDPVEEEIIQQFARTGAPATGQGKLQRQQDSRTSIERSKRKEIKQMPERQKYQAPPRKSQYAMKKTVSANLNKQPQKRIEKKAAPEIEAEEEDNTCSQLVLDTQKELYKNAVENPGKNLKATSTRRVMTAAPIIMTDEGPVEASRQIISEQTVTRSPGRPEIISRNLTGVENVGGGQAMKTELGVSKLISPRAGKNAEPQMDTEVVYVKDTILIGPGIKQSSHTVTYDTDKQKSPGGAAAAGPPSPQQVSQMIDEETEDVENTRNLHVPELAASRPATFGIKKRVQPLQLKQDSVQALEQSIVNPFPSPDEEQEDPQPEMLALIMHTEENGLAMGSQPGKVYKHLFPDSRDDAVLEITSVAPAPLQDVVVPKTALPDQTQDQNKDPNVIQALMVASNSPERPVDNAYAEVIKQASSPEKPKNTARKGKRPKETEIPALAEELPPWAIQDYEPIVDLVGASPAGTLTVEAEDEVNQTELNPAEGIEYMLHMEGPLHSSRVQLRGTQKPSWFPGYYLATPEIPDIITLAKSPSEVLAAAWKATQPNIFPDNSFFIV